MPTAVGAPAQRYIHSRPSTLETLSRQRPRYSLLFPLNVASIVRFVILPAPVSPRDNSEHQHARAYPPCSTFDGVCFAPSTGCRSSTGT